MESISDSLKTIFRGPLPVLTESFQYVLALAVSIISSSTIFLITGYELDIILALILGIAFGIATQVCLALFIPKFYGKITPHSEMDEMLNKVLGQNEPVGAFEVWTVNSPSMFITPHTSLFARSLVISDAMQEGMKKSPENAEIVLTERVLELHNRVQFLNLFFTTTLFTVFLVVHLYFIMPLLGIFGSNLMTILGGPLAYLIGGIFVLLVIFRGATWRRSRAFEIVHNKYQLHPGVAEKCLLENRELTPIETEDLLILLRHREIKNRSERMASITILIVGFSFLFGLLLTYVLSLFVTTVLTIVTIGFILFLPIGISVIFAIFLIKRFDDRAIDRLYGKYELKTEPIWSD